MLIDRIVQVPLFLTPYSPIPAYAAISALGGLRISKDSFAPQIDSVPLYDGASNPARIANLVCDIPGHSDMIFAPIAGAPVSTSSWHSGYYMITSGNNAAYLLDTFPQPREPASYPVSRFRTTAVVPNLAPLIAVGVPMNNGQNTVVLPGLLYAPVSPGGGMLCMYYDGTWHSFFAWGIGLTLFPQTWSGVTEYNQVPAPDGWIYTYLGDNGSHPKLNFYWKPGLILTDISSLMTTPVFSDNAVLQAAFANPALHNVSGWFGGFLIHLNTGGLGPTGQQWEIAVTDYRMTTYNLLRLVPQESTAQVAMARPAATKWTSKIDTNGIFYWNSGHASDVQSIWYSYSPIPWAYPQLAYAPPPPITLPCYTPCFPS